MILHASCAAAKGPKGPRALLITGPSGAGKSSLVLEMLALGAHLLADDRTQLHTEGTRLMASCPGSIRGMIEARGIGILRAPSIAVAEVVAILDLGQNERLRTPPARAWTALGVSIPLLYKPETGCLPSAMMLYLQFGTADQS